MRPLLVRLDVGVMHLHSVSSATRICPQQRGMVAARDASVLQRIRHMRSHGMTTDTLARDADTHIPMMSSCWDITIGWMNCAPLWVWCSSPVYRNGIREDMSSPTIIGSFLMLRFRVVVPFDQTRETAAHLMSVLLPAKVNRQRVMDRLARRYSVKYTLSPIHNLLLPGEISG